MVLSNQSYAGWFSNLTSTIVSTTLGLPTPSNAILYSITTSLGFLTDCPSGSVDGIRTQCFSSSEQSKLSQAADILKARQYQVNRGGPIDPYNHFKSHTSSLINWDNAMVRLSYLVGYASGCNGNNVLACHVVDGTTFFTANGLSQDIIYIAGVYVHEADHYNKVHTCGDSADADTSGPYGLEAFYDMSNYLNPPAGVTAGQASIAYSRAYGIANYQLCNNTSARDQVLNYTNSVSLLVPTTTTVPPTRPVKCATCGIP